MYAIIKAGGKQHKVSKGDLVDIDAFFEGEAGAEVSFPALLVSKEGKTQVGAPTVPGCKVHGKLVDIVAGPKVTSVNIYLVITARRLAIANTIRGLRSQALAKSF